ncbi:MAG: DUF3488 domain-containing protein, partial [Acidobacteria bacterium]|nr:DUF3488 domain-containing protein [Acidobacteriota bacterium]
LTVAYIPFYFLDMLFLLESQETILERVLLATLHLIFFAAVIKMFSARQPRDYLYLAALAFAQILAAATLTVQTSFLLYFALFLLLAISTFTSFEIKRARQRISDPGSDLPPGSSRLGTALTGISGGVCLGIILLAAILFFVLPRASRGYFSSLARSSDRISGFSNQVELGTIGQIKKLSSVVMHIRVPGLSPGNDLKWRGIGLTTFDGKRWFNRSPLAQSVRGQRNFQLRQEIVHPGQAPRLLRYTIILQPLASDVLFLTPQPLELTGPFRRLWQDEAGSVYMRSYNDSLVRYSALSDIAVPRPDLLRSENREIPPAIQEVYLQLPPTDPRLKPLAVEITRGYRSIYDKSKAIETYLQKTYQYTLELPPAMPDDPIAYFLWETRQGHCEFFAAAMAVLLRSIEIPARLVNGFLQGSFNDVSGQYTVRASDAHTWVEVYFPSHGWVSFDPTPAEGRSSQPPLLGRLSIYLDALQAFWEEWIINYDFLHQVTLARQFERTSRQLTSDSRQFFRQRYRYLVGLVRFYTEQLLEHRLGLMLALAFLALGIAALYWRTPIQLWVREWTTFQRSRQGRARPEDATVFYVRLLRLLARRGWRKLPAQTPTEFAETIPEPTGQLVRNFTSLYLATRFGRLPDLLPGMGVLLREIQNQAEAPSD